MLFTLAFWTLFGWFADYSFPYGQAVELILNCLKGTVSAKINRLQKQLQSTELVSQPDNEQQIKKLNNLESQVWLYQGVLARLGRHTSVSHERIAKTIEALEYKRKEILQELEPRRPEKYRTLASIQEYVRSLLASQAEKDYIQLEKIVSHLVNFARNEPTSETILEKLLGITSVEIAQNASLISPYRLRLAFKIEELLRIISIKIASKYSSNETEAKFQEMINDLSYQVSVLSEQFNNLLENNQNKLIELNKRNQEMERITRIISGLYKEISERDTDISALRKEIQNRAEDVQDKQSQVYRLLAEIERLSNKNLEMQRQNEILIQDQRIKQSKIEELNKQIIEVSETQGRQSSSTTGEPQPSLKIGTKKTLTPEEYREISNKSDYLYVKAHFRNGSPVRAYYRRRPSK